MTDPASTEVRIAYSSDWTSIDNIYFNNTALIPNIDLSTYLLKLRAGDIARIENLATGDVWFYELPNPIALSGTVTRFPSPIYISGPATQPSAGDDIKFTFYSLPRTSGTSGSSGTSGAQGPAGPVSTIASAVNLTTTSANADYRVLLVDEAGLSSETLYVDSNDGLTFNPSLNYLQSKGEVIAYYASDRRLKDNIIPILNPLEKLAKINGYEFDWNKNQQVYKGHDVGVIAQEIEEILPELVTTRDNGDKAVKYEKLTAFLISVVKEQQKQIDELKSKL